MAVKQTDSGKIKAKTVDKMLDQQLALEGMFSVALLCKTDGERHYFETQSDGWTTAKSTLDMFDSREIDNDLKSVDTAIREYWSLNPIKKLASETVETKQSKRSNG